MYAVIETGGKQYRVEEGNVVFIEKLDVAEGSNVTFDKVVALGSEDGLKIGAPVVEGAVVTAKVLKNGKAKKVTVFTYRPKKDSKRKMGHRQPYTKVEIETISLDGVSAPKAADEAAPAKKPAAKKPAAKKTAAKKPAEETAEAAE